MATEDQSKTDFEERLKARIDRHRAGYADAHERIFGHRPDRVEPPPDLSGLSPEEALPAYEAWARRRTLAGWEENDMFIWQIAPDIEPFPEGFLRQFCIDQRARLLDRFLETGKPLAVAVHATETPFSLQVLSITRQHCAEHGVPFYDSVYKASLAISRFMDWHARHDQRAED